MLILFSLIIMRMSGAIAWNPIFGRNQLPVSVKTALIFVLSLMLYIGFDGILPHEPISMLEYGVMLVKELFFGFVISFIMDLSLLIIKSAAAIMDYMMGLSMAQVYDPQYNEQATISSGLFNGFLILLFFAVNGHVRLISMFYLSAEIVPFGMVSISPMLAESILDIFRECITMGVQFAFPILAIELITEAAMGILMRIIPQINIFAVHFQLKISIGLLMLVFLFSPMSDKLYQVLDYMFQAIQGILPALAGM